MTKSSNRREPPPGPPLSQVTIAVGAIVVVGIGVVIWIELISRYGDAGAEVALNAIRTAGALTVATGGAVALLLAALRQRSTELTLVHTNRDAIERRITELYTKAADQLGSDQAPVRLAGLYALERLANSTSEHRQTIVNVICAYLRMPYTPPPERPQTRSNAYRNPRPRRRQHQAFTDRPSASPPLGNAVFADAQFARGADFAGARFTGDADFGGARFTGIAYIVGARFTGNAHFGGAQFTRIASFANAQSTGVVDFERARVALAVRACWPPGWTVRSARPDMDEDPGYRYLVRVEDGATE